MPIGKLCWSCKNVRFYTASEGYSEFTPGSDFHFYCSKYHWEFDQYDNTLEDWRAYIEQAETCLDFEQREDVS